MSYTSNNGTDSGRGLRVGVFGFLIPVVIIGSLVYSVVSNTPPSGANNGASMPSAVAQRIAKVGTLSVRDNSVARAPRSGEEVFTKGPCTTCHATGALGSPKLGDKAAWAPRIASGNAALVTSALKGKNGMPPQGGGEYSDLEIARAVVYVANAGGAKFVEPAAPEPVAAASAAK